MAGRALCAAVAAVLAVELALELVDARERDRAAARVAPTYSRALFTSGGDRISPDDGILRLRLTPFRGVAAEPGLVGPPLTTSSLGFRGSEIGPKRPDRFRVLLSGGSTAFGSGLASDDSTLAVQLERRLPSVEVIDVALDAYTSGHELATLVFAGMDLAPDAVVSLGGWNDFYQLRVGHDVPEYEEQIERQLVRSARAADPNVLRRWPWGAIETFLPAIARRLGVRDSIAPRGGDATLVPDPDRSAAAYVANVSRMARISAAMGAGFLVVIQPDRCEMDARIGAAERDGCLRAFSERYTRFRELATSALRDAGVRVVDLGDGEAELPATLFTDPVHLTAEGYRRLAELLAPRVRELADPVRRAQAADSGPSEAGAPRP
ncbi:MAG TPA: SGNH/GDSL hydrolase family protein [Candidatus Binatia bacterium]|nr:SGNH/GDSL hydrolase family protein [Candidatus Binatia bacterium]